MELNKVVVLALAMVLVASMAVAGVSNNLVLLAKKSSGSDSGNTDSGSGGSGSSSGDNNNGGHDDKGSSETKTTEEKPSKVDDGGFATTGQGIDERTGKPVVEDQPQTNKGLPSIMPSPSGQPDKGCAFHPEADKCKPDSSGKCPGGFGMNDDGHCFPDGPCPGGFGRHDNDESGTCFPDHQPGNFCHFHNCVPTHTHVVVVHQTKVVHKKELGVGIPTVFVPKIGLVEPLNCKLNENSGKINCEFAIIKVIN